MSVKPLVSVIIPTKNSEATIEKCLGSIRNQTYLNIEIIVVDSFSRDKTKEVAENYGAKIVLVNAKRSKARNIGAEKARGEVILFVDSDMELDSTIIEECVKKVREGYHAVIVPEVSVGQGFWARCKALEKSCYAGDELIEASRFFKKEVFKGVEGHDPQLEAGEDWDLHQRISKAGYRIGRINAFIKHHEGKLSLWKTMKKKHQYGKTLRRYKCKHPIEAKQQLKLIRPSFVKNWGKLARDPMHAFGMLFMKACEFGAGWLGSRVTHEVNATSHVTVKVVELIAQLSGRPNLDAGCGDGRYGTYFNGEVIALDLNPQHLAKRASALNYKDRVLGTICSLPFRSAIFDTVLCSEVIEHMSKLEGKSNALKELKRVSKYLIITTPNRNMWFQILHRLLRIPENPGHVSKWTAKDLQEEGFRVHGCLGWVTAQKVPSRVLRRIWNFLAFNCPDVFGGDLIGIKEFKGKCAG